MAADLQEFVEGLILKYASVKQPLKLGVSQTSSVNLFYEAESQSKAEIFPEPRDSA